MATATNLNEIRVSDLNWTGRTATALRNGGLLDKTLADLDTMKPEELLSVNRLGRGALAEITKHVTQNKARARELKLREEMARRKAEPAVTPTPAVRKEPVSEIDLSDPVVEFAKSHSAMIQGIMNGEMVLVPKS